LTAVLAGCQGPDVGQKCELQTGAGGVNLNVVSVPADFFESGNLGCDNLVCIKSPDQPAGSRVTNNPYCSKACVSNSDCSQSETGLVCRPVTVDLNFINSLPRAQRDQYYQVLGCQIASDGTPTQCPLQFQSYCAAPLQ
jgi:hypothetical protein